MKTFAFLTPAVNGKKAELIEVQQDDAPEKESYLLPTGELVEVEAVAQNEAEESEQYMPVRPYFVSNAMAELDELRQDVLRLMAAVDRSAVGSAERLAAERELITAKSNLRTGLSARASELEASISALKTPGADEGERRRLDSELAAVKRALEVVEDEPATIKNTSNAPGEATARLFAQQGKKTRVVQGMFGPVVMVE